MVSRTPLVTLVLLALVAVTWVPMRAQAVDDPAADQEQEQPRLQGPAQLRLGFMLPFPFGDSAIPPRLADEWLSAAKLGLNLLASQYEQYFTVEYYVTNSNCSRDSAEQAAQALVADGVHAVVGPACSESAIGADIVLRVYNIPFISFAATADIFSTAKFSTLFRTAFPDVYQGRAIAAVVKQYKITNLVLLYSNEAYGQGMNASVQAALEGFGLQTPVLPIPVPNPPPSDPAAYEAILGAITDTSPSTAIVLATQPNVARALLQAAMNLKKIQYPWWYLGSDGATAMDLVGEGESMAGLAGAIQGEIGVGPYNGVSDSGEVEPGFGQFVDYWAKQPYSTYPGLLTLPSAPRETHPRSYVVNLIDAIWTFHEVAKIIIQSQHSLTRSNILDCLRGKGPCVGSPIQFQGASGWVAYNTTSGDRLANPPNVQGPTMYSVKNLVGMTWETVGTWESGQTTGLSGAKVLEVTRPGPIPPGTPVLPDVKEAPKFEAPEEMLAYAQAHPEDDAPEQSSSSSTVYVYGGGMSTGTLVALIILSTLLAFTAIGAIIYWQRNRKNREHASYGRMI